MKFYNLLNDWAKKKFNEIGFESHYSAGEVLKYDGGIKDALYMQRNRKSKNIHYFRFSGGLGTIGATWTDRTNWCTPDSVRLDYFWCDIRVRKISKKSFSIFSIKRKESKLEVSIGFIEAIKSIPFIANILQDYNDWRIHVNIWHYYGEDEAYKAPSAFRFIYDAYKQRQRIKKCNHEHMEVDSHITGDSGSEDLYCPDCGFTDHIQYY